MRPWRTRRRQLARGRVRPGWACSLQFQRLGVTSMRKTASRRPSSLPGGPSARGRHIGPWRLAATGISLVSCADAGLSGQRVPPPGDARRAPAYQHLRRTLQHAIENGELTAGQALPERARADQAAGPVARDRSQGHLRPRRRRPAGAAPGLGHLRRRAHRQVVLASSPASPTTCARAGSTRSRASSSAASARSRRTRRWR